jgi:hypothetical protein
VKWLILVFVTAGAAMSFPVQADTSCEQPCVKQMVTDFRGRPPFKRSFEWVSATDSRSNEAAVKPVHKPRSKPPYERRQPNSHASEAL